MDQNIFKGKWHELKGKAKRHWGELTDDDIEKVQGRSEELSGLLQKKYGYNKDKADQAIDDFMKDEDRDKY